MPVEYPENIMRYIIRDAERAYADLGVPAPWRVFTTRYGTNLSRTYGIQLMDLMDHMHETRRVYIVHDWERARRVVWPIEAWNALTPSERAGEVGLGRLPRAVPPRELPSILDRLADKIERTD